MRWELHFVPMPLECHGHLFLTHANAFQVVKRPMDLNTIKQQIDNGEITTTRGFEHAVMLMVNNAIMYNDKAHFV